MEDENPNEESKGSGFNGENIRLTEAFRPRLSKPLDKGAIKQHPTKSFLSTIKSIYVVERLNDVFGVMGWDFEHEVVGIYDNTTFDRDGNEAKKRPYVVVAGRIYVREFDLYTPIQYGGHEIDDKGTDPADGFKSAVTDAMSKCASLLEIGIQVFKGQPDSQERNVSKRLDEPKTSTIQETKPLEKPSYDPPAGESFDTGMIEEAPLPSAEPMMEEEPEPPMQEEEDIPTMPEPIEDDVDPEMEELIERHKELFGKAPSSRAKAETIRNKILKEERKIELSEEADNEEDDFNFYVDAPSASPVEEDREEEIIVDEETSPDNLDDDDDEVPFGEEDDFMEVYRKEIYSYLDADDLKDNGGAIIFDATMSEATEDQIKELKQLVNKRYIELKNG
jgi:hypothetical protein